MTEALLVSQLECFSHTNLPYYLSHSLSPLNLLLFPPFLCVHVLVWVSSWSSFTHPMPRLQRFFFVFFFVSRLISFSYNHKHKSSSSWAPSILIMCVLYISVPTQMSLFILIILTMSLAFCRAACCGQEQTDLFRSQLQSVTVRCDILLTDGDLNKGQSAVNIQPQL